MGRFQFVKKVRLFCCISLAIMIVCLGINIIFKTEISVDFKGGTIMTYAYSGEGVNVDDIADVTENTLSVSGVKVNTGTSIGSDNTGSQQSVSIEIARDITDTEHESLINALNEKYPEAGFEQLNFNTVPARVGTSLFAKGLYSIFVAFLFMLIYIAIRFRKIGGWLAGSMALLALVHDSILIYFAFVVFRLPIDDNFIAVILTTLGYSLNDTIVIYDRIRDNRKIYGSSRSLEEITDISINQSFRRSVNISICTFFGVATITVVGFIAGIESIISFSLPMCVSVIAGSYSTICIAAPLWAVLAKKLDERKAEKNKRLSGSRNKNKTGTKKARA